MEDSAKRRARLQAMRMEASSSSTEASSPSISTSNTPLSNPLVHPSAPSLESPLSPHRFDYYTDPAAAYSAVKRKTINMGGDAGHGGHYHPPKFSSPIRSASPLTNTAAQSIAGQQMENHMLPSHSSHTRPVPSPNQSFYGTPFSGPQTRPQTGSLRSPVQYPSPASRDIGAHARQAPSPNQSFHNTRFPRFQTGSLRSPVQYPSPVSGDRGAHAHQFPSPNQSFYNTQFPRSQSGLLRSPVQYPSPASGGRGDHCNFFRPWNMSGNSSEHIFTPNSSNCGPSSSRYGGSPQSHSHGKDMQFKGRGGYHNQYYGSGRRVDKFVNKSMVKDPWRKLKPIVGNILVPLLEPLSWLPTSIAPKKAKVAEVSTVTKPNQNLAEFLALAFEDSINSEQEGEGSMMPNPNNRD